MFYVFLITKFLPHKGIDGDIAEDREWLCPDADNEGKGDGNDTHGACREREVQRRVDHRLIGLDIAEHFLDDE